MKDRYSLEEFEHTGSFERADGHMSYRTTEGQGNPFSYVRTRARIAVYDDLMSAPRIIDIEPAPVLEFMENIAATTYEFAQKQGGSLPYSVIREIAENFIHASFVECTVSVLNNGNTICFSDQGPGIERKRLVQQPGITSASADMKKFIRGVGSGFPIVKEYLDYRNGYLTIDDNAQRGTVITLSIRPESTEPHPKSLSKAEKAEAQKGIKALDQRSSMVLRLLYERGIMGPSDLIGPLGVSAATAHRVLIDLEKKGLIESTPNRKRILSSIGVAFLESGDGY